MQEYELYGFSLFETFLARKGSFWRLEDHWNRLATSASRFGMETPDHDRFIKNVRGYHDTTRDEVIRYTLMQMGGRWSSGDLRTETRLLKRAWKPAETRPIRLYSEERPLPAGDEMRCHKSGSRLLYQSSYHMARSRGYDDCIFTDDEGYLLESSTHSLMVCLNGNWYTPPLSRGLLPGVARGWLIAEKGVSERDLRHEDLEHCDGVVAANSVRGLMTVCAVGARMVPTVGADTFIKEVGERNFIPLGENSG